MAPKIEVANVIGSTALLPHFHMCQNIDGEEDALANSPPGREEILTPTPMNNEV